MRTCFKLVHLTSHLKECQNLEILSSIISLPSSGFRMLLALHPQCLVLEKTLNTGQGHVTDFRRPVSIGTGSSQLHPFKNEAVTVQNTLPFCFQGSPYHSAYFQYLFIIIYRVFILSDNYCLSLIILSRLTEPLFTCLADYWQEVIQNLSNRERTLYPFISSAGPIYVSN